MENQFKHSQVLPIPIECVKSLKKGHYEHFIGPFTVPVYTADTCYHWYYHKASQVLLKFREMWRGPTTDTRLKYLGYYSEHEFNPKIIAMVTLNRMMAGLPLLANFIEYGKQQLRKGLVDKRYDVNPGITKKSLLQIAKDSINDKIFTRLGDKSLQQVLEQSRFINAPLLVKIIESNPELIGPPNPKKPLAVHKLLIRINYPSNYAECYRVYMGYWFNINTYDTRFKDYLPIGNLHLKEKNIAIP